MVVVEEVLCSEKVSVKPIKFLDVFHLIYSKTKKHFQVFRSRDFPKLQKFDPAGLEQQKINLVWPYVRQEVVGY